MGIEMLGKILVSGWGNKVLIGVILGFLEGVTPMRVYEYIRDNLGIAYWLTEDDWNKYRDMAEGVDIGTITTEDIIEGLRKHRTDILGEIINNPDGMKWLQKQVDVLTKKLGLG